MIIQGAWAVKLLPCHYVVEIPELGLRMMQIVPFREISDTDLQPYDGPHPRKLHGVPMPDHLYSFYGLEKSAEAASEIIRVRLTPADKAALEAKAKAAGLTMTEYIRKIAREGV